MSTALTCNNPFPTVTTAPPRSSCCLLFGYLLAKGCTSLVLQTLFIILHSLGKRAPLPQTVVAFYLHMHWHMESIANQPAKWIRKGIYGLLVLDLCNGRQHLKRLFLVHPDAQQQCLFNIIFLFFFWSSGFSLWTLKAVHHTYRGTEKLLFYERLMQKQLFSTRQTFCCAVLTNKM